MVINNGFYSCGSQICSIVVVGDEKDAGGHYEIKDGMSDLYFVSGSAELFTEEPVLSNLPVGDLKKSAAHW